MTKLATFTYYFLNKRLHPPLLPGYRSSVVLLIVNKNSTANHNKFLFIREVTLGSVSWGLPKEGLESKVIIEDIYTSVARNLEEELGFKGTKVFDTKPLLKQNGLIFDFAIQKYDAKRAAWEIKRNRPPKGKIYQLAIMEYRGPDQIPLNTQNKESELEIDAYKWVDRFEGLKLIESSATTFVESSAKFNLGLFDRIVDFYSSLTSHLSAQATLF